MCMHPRVPGVHPHAGCRCPLVPTQAACRCTHWRVCPAWRASLHACARRVLPRPDSAVNKSMPTVPPRAASANLIGRRCRPRQTGSLTGPRTSRWRREHLFTALPPYTCVCDTCALPPPHSCIAGARAAGQVALGALLWGSRMPGLCPPLWGGRGLGGVRALGGPPRPVPPPLFCPRPFRAAGACGLSSAP